MLRQAGSRGARAFCQLSCLPPSSLWAKAFVRPTGSGARIVGDRTLRFKTCTVQSARSTYLNQRFRYILGQVGDRNLAVSCKRERRSSGSLWWPCAFSLLCNTSGWCDGGGGRGLCLGGSLSWWQASRSSSAAGAGWTVLHDGVERLVELSRHGELWFVV